MYIPYISPPFFHPFPQGFLTFLLYSCPAFGAPSQVSCVNIRYFCSLEFILPIFRLAQRHPPSDISLTPFLWHVLPHV